VPQLRSRRPTEPYEVITSINGGNKFIDEQVLQPRASLNQSKEQTQIANLIQLTI